MSADGRVRRERVMASGEERNAGYNLLFVGNDQDEFRVCREMLRAGGDPIPAADR